MARLTGDAPSVIVDRYHGKGYAKLKEDLSDVVIDFLAQIQKAYHSVRQDATMLNRYMRIGLEKATDRSADTIKEVKARCGLY